MHDFTALNGTTQGADPGGGAARGRTLWPLGKTAFCEKSDDISLVLAGFCDLCPAGALVEGFREDKSSRLGEDVCASRSVARRSVDGLTRLVSSFAC